MTETMKIVEAMGKINFEGNITPHNWFCHLRFKNQKPHVNAIMLLSEIVYWYRPTVVKDEATGRVIEVRKKFKADKLQRSYNSFAEQFGFTKRQVKEALKFLEAKGLITLDFRHITTDAGTKLANVLFIGIDPEKIEFITHVTVERKTSDSTTVDVYASNGRRGTLECQTNTESTTETVSSLSLRDQAQNGEMTTETELAMLAEWGRGGKAGVADPSQDIGQYIQFRDEVLQIFEDKGGDFGRGKKQREARRDAIIEFANNQEQFDLDRWRNTLHTSIVIGSVQPSNLACFFDVYEAGGDYQEMCRQRKNGGKQNAPNNRTGRVPGSVPKYSVADPAAFGEQLQDDDGLGDP